jgi:DNA-binding protein HU-beta
MTKAELIERIASKKDLPRGMTKKAVARLIDSVFTEIGDYFIRAKPTRNSLPRFSYPGFGTFTKRRRNARIVRNPQDGSPIALPPKSTISFTPGKELKGLINNDARDLRATSNLVAMTGS